MRLKNHENRDWFNYCAGGADGAGGTDGIDKMDDDI